MTSNFRSSAQVYEIEGLDEKRSGLQLGRPVRHFPSRDRLMDGERAEQRQPAAYREMIVNSNMPF